MALVSVLAAGITVDVLAGLDVIPRAWWVIVPASVPAAAAAARMGAP